MRSKEVFDYSRSTGYPWSVAASTIRVADQSEGPARHGHRTSRDLAQPGKGCLIMTIGQRRTCRLVRFIWNRHMSIRRVMRLETIRCDPYATLQDF
jgi:hypothetical protein